MTPEQIQTLRGQTVIDVETAAAVIGIGRTLAFQLARERGELCEGVKVLRIGRLLKVPTRPLLAVLGYTDPLEVDRDDVAC
ncbi:MAG: DNA-binding protein [Thermoleophilia bacterium]|nr:DNA-binding protein [Thermoleophilia bacterium]